MKITLGEVGTYINGYAFKPSDWGTSGLPIIRIQNLTNQNTIPNYFDGPYNSKFEVNKGDILIAWSGSLGIHVWQKNKALLNQHIFRVEFNKCEIDKMYFYYAVKYNIHKMLHLTHGATMRHIIKSDFEKIVIPYPSLVVQAKISKILNYLEQNIINYRTILSKLDLLIKSRFVELFGDVVLNTLNWPLVKLSAIAEYRIGLTYKPEAVSSSGIAVLRSGNIQNSQLCYKDTIYVNSKVEPKLLLKKKDILMCARNGSQSLVGKVALIENDISNTTYGAFMMAISSKYYVYLFEYFRSQAFRRLISVGSTTTINQVTTRMLNSIVIPLPDLDTINRFALYHSQINKLKFG